MAQLRPRCVEVFPSMLAVLCAAALLAACGGSSPSSGSGGSSQNGPMVGVPSDFCSLVTPANLSAIFGHAVQAAHQELNAGGEVDCSNTPSPETVDFSIFRGPWCYNNQPASSQCTQDRARVFASNKQTKAATEHSVVSIAGLGDQAYCGIDTVGLANLRVLKSWIYLNVSTDNSCAHSEAIARILLSKL